MNEPLLGTLAGVLCATAFGAMVFFAAVMAPLIFTALPEDVAGGFLRRVFPRYYLVLAGVTAAAAAAAALAAPVAAGVLALTCLGFVYARQRQMPRINRLRDAMLAGDGEAAQGFHRGHRASVALNLVQMIALLAVLITLLG